MSKKFSLAALALFVSVTLLLSGCNSNNKGNNSSGSDDGGSSSKKVTLSILSWETESKIKPLLDAFQEQHKNVSFDFQYAPPVTDYVQKLQSMLLTNTAPDIFVLLPENRAEVFQGNYALDLSDQPFMQNITQNNKNMYLNHEDQKVYGMAQSSWIGGIWYNEELFQKAGIQGEPNSWEEFMEACAKLKAAGVTPIYDNFQDGSMSSVVGLFATETQTSNPKFDEDVLNGKKSFADGWTVPFQMVYNDLISNDYLSPDMVGMSGDQIRNDFATGRVAMILGTVTDTQTFKEINPDLSFKMMGIPGTTPGNKRYFGTGGVGYAVNSQTENKEAALAFLDFMMTEQGLDLYREMGYLITVNGYDQEVEPEVEEAYQGLLQSLNYQPMTYWKKHSEALRNQLIIASQDMVTGKITPEEAAKSFDQKFHELENQ